MALDDFRKGLRSTLRRSVARGHAVAGVDVIENTDRKIDDLFMAKTLKRKGGDAPMFIVAVVVMQERGGQLTCWIVKVTELGVEQFYAVRTVGWNLCLVGDRKPFFSRIIDKFDGGGVLAKIVVREKEVGGHSLEELQDRAGFAGEPGGAFAIGVDLRTLG